MSSFDNDVAAERLKSKDKSDILNKSKSARIQNQLSKSVMDLHEGLTNDVIFHLVSSKL